VALEESTLGYARVDLLGLGDHDRLILHVVEDGHLSDAVVLETALNNVLLEEALETQDLLIKLDIGWLELHLNISARSRRAKVVGVLDL